MPEQLSRYRLGSDEWRVSPNLFLRIDALTVTVANGTDSETLLHQTSSWRDGLVDDLDKCND